MVEKLQNAEKKKDTLINNHIHADGEEKTEDH